MVRRGRKLDSEIEIVDAQGALCPPGQSGAVRVRNPYMVNGYVNDAKATARCFRDGWFYPGDIGQWGPNGELDILGRNDEIFSFGGVKIDAQLIDVIIKSTPGVRDAVCFKSPKADRNEVCAFIVFEPDTNKSAGAVQVRENYRKHTGLPCFLGPLHEIDEVPYTENGRPMRALCQELILDRAKATRVLDDV